MYTAHDILKLLQSDKMKFCHWKAGWSYTWKSEEAITAYVPYWRKTKEAYAFSQLYQNHSRSPDPVAKKVSIWYPTHQFHSLFCSIDWWLWGYTPISQVHLILPIYTNQYIGKTRCHIIRHRRFFFVTHLFSVQFARSKAPHRKAKWRRRKSLNTTANMSRCRRSQTRLSWANTS